LNGILDYIQKQSMHKPPQILQPKKQIQSSSEIVKTRNKVSMRFI
jgi:hypothetical protein